MRVIYDVPLLPQCKSLTCWYACLLMIVRWKKGKSGGVSAEVYTAEAGADFDSPEIAAEVCGKNVYLNLAVPEAATTFARMANLKTIYQSLTPSALGRVLQNGGPVIYAGRVNGYRGFTNPITHAIVLRGIDDKTLYINDPAPPGVGLQFTLAYSRLLSELPSGTKTPLLQAGKPLRQSV